MTPRKRKKIKMGSEGGHDEGDAGWRLLLSDMGGDGDAGAYLQRAYDSVHQVVD